MGQRPALPGLHGAALRRVRPVELVRLGRARWGVRECLELRAPAGFLCPAAADFIRGCLLVRPGLQKRGGKFFWQKRPKISIITILDLWWM